MFRLIYRQRRRIPFCSLFLSMALMVAAANMSGFFAVAAELPLWITVLSFAAVGLIVFACAAQVIAVSILFLPRWRNAWEMIAIAVFLMLVLDAAIPGLSDIAWLSAGMPLVVIVLTVSVLDGPLLDRFRLWVDRTGTRGFQAIRLKRFWAALIPDAQNL
ncbi:MAG: hypothetical protein QNJ16_15690 [Rhodobacter sp.]|nr:hypothetical protein [Rhodobacter sp.]